MPIVTLHFTSTMPEACWRMVLKESAATAQWQGGRGDRVQPNSPVKRPTASKQTIQSMSFTKRWSSAVMLKKLTLRQPRYKPAPLSAASDGPMPLVGSLRRRLRSPRSVQGRLHELLGSLDQGFLTLGIVGLFSRCQALPRQLR